MKNKLTPQNIYKIKRVISIVILIFGIFFILQGVFPKEKEKLEERLAKLEGGIGVIKIGGGSEVEVG